MTSGPCAAMRRKVFARSGWTRKSPVWSGEPSGRRKRARVSGWSVVRKLALSAARKRLIAKPCSASVIAGWSASAREMVPQLRSAVVTPRRVPGTPTEIPLVDACVKSMPANMSGVATAGAFSRDSTANVSFVFARWIIMKPPPPMPENWGSTTFWVNWTAAAASIALPPFSSTLAPASAASGCDTATTPCRKALPVQEGGPASTGACAVPGSSVPGGTPIVSCGQSPHEGAVIKSARQNARAKPDRAYGRSRRIIGGSFPAAAAKEIQRLGCRSNPACRWSMATRRATGRRSSC